jgi:hypothetical protein
MNRIPLTRFRYGFLGPAVILLAFGQATGELIQWPFLLVKYKTFFLFLLLPACLIQFPIFSYLARHTVITGESFFSTLLKSSKSFAVLVCAIFLVTSVWISSYTAAGGVAIVKLINSLFNLSLDLPIWSGFIALAVNTIFFAMLLARAKTYKLVKISMDWVAGCSFFAVVALFIWALARNGWDSTFFIDAFRVKTSLPTDWDPRDTKIVLSAFIFAGLGGLWNILYSTWVRNEQLGMAKFNNDEFLDYRSQWPEIEPDQESKLNLGKNMTLLHRDLWLGIVLNFLMLIMLGYMAYSFFPADQHAPSGLGIITVLADSVSFGAPVIGAIFYLFLGLFLMDTWLTAADSLSKVFANFLAGVRGGPGAEAARQASRAWYVSVLVFLWLMTIFTTFVSQPQQLIFLNGILSSLGSILLIVGVWLNEVALRRHYPWLPKSTLVSAGLAVAFVIYLGLGILYLLS